MNERDTTNIWDRLRANGSAGVPSIAAGMAAAEIKRYAPRTEPGSALKAAPSAPKAALTKTPLANEKPPRWPYNQSILAHMDERHGGDHSVAAISRAMRELVEKDGLSVGAIAAKFTDYSPTIALLLAVCNLHPSLRPALDKLKTEPGRITVEALQVLLKIPMSRQPAVWEAAQESIAGEKNNGRLCRELKRLGADHIRRFDARYPVRERSRVLARPLEESLESSV